MYVMTFSTAAHRGPDNGSHTAARQAARGTRAGGTGSCGTKAAAGHGTPQPCGELLDWSTSVLTHNPSSRTGRTHVSCEKLINASSPEQAAEPACVRLQKYRQALQVGVAMSCTDQAARCSAGRRTAGSAEPGEAVHGGARLGAQRRRMVRCSTCQSPGPLAPASAGTYVP